jgi:hypothetical protein
MHMNAQEFVRMHQNTPGTTHILTQEKPSGLKAKLTWTDMGWTGCGRAIRRAIRAPMCHYMSSKSSSSDSSPSPSSSTVSSVGWMRVPATMLRGRCAARVRLATFSRRIWRRAGDEDELPVRLHHEAVQAGLDLSAAAGMRMHANAYICIRMHTNAYECKRIHMNADECIHE